MKQYKKFVRCIAMLASMVAMLVAVSTPVSQVAADGIQSPAAAGGEASDMDVELIPAPTDPDPTPLPPISGPKSPDEGIRLGAPMYNWRYTTNEATWIAEHLDFVIMEQAGWLNPRLKALNAHMRSINPDIIILVYRPWAEADRGSPNAVVKNWLRSVNKYGFDGIFVDMCKSIGTQGQREYAFFEYAYPFFEAENKLLIPNLDGAKYNGLDDTWQRIIQVTHGGLEEAFVTYCAWIPGHPFQTEARWEWEVEQLENSGEQDKYYLAMGQNRGMARKYTIYNAASFLMGKSGTKDFLYSGPQATYALSEFKADYERFKHIYTAPIGSPLDGKYKADGVWQRDYSEGRVLVNPTTNTYTIDLGGTYATVDGAMVSSVTLGANGAEILLNVVTVL
ncbi:MAG: hypothetical protein SVY53_08535 [Chloroflexota bacterium]|nr:hypothetical protein [Chloroflexota bacterium]